MKRQPTTLLTQRSLREQVNQPNDGFSFSTGEDHPWSLDLDGAKDSPSHQDVHDVGRPEVSEVPSAPSILPLQVAKALQGNRQKLSSSTFFAVLLFNQKWYLWKNRCFGSNCQRGVRFCLEQKSLDAYRTIEMDGKLFLSCVENNHPKHEWIML